MSEESTAERLRFAGLVAAIFVLLTVPRLLLHELWRDEAWLWLVVTESRSPADLFAPNPDGTSPDRVVIVDIFKEYPIGNSRSWLPKAIEDDGLRVNPLLQTPQVRVLEVSAPESLARLQP